MIGVGVSAHARGTGFLCHSWTGFPKSFPQTGPAATLDVPRAAGLLDRKDRLDRFLREKRVLGRAIKSTAFGVADSRGITTLPSPSLLPSVTYVLPRTDFLHRDIGILTFRVNETRNLTIE